MSDRAEILDLLYATAWAIDDADWDALAGLFAKGTMRVGDVSLTGADIARQSRESVRLYDGRPLTAHLVQNPQVTLEPDGRRAASRCMVHVLQGVPPDFPLQTIAVSEYRDAYVRDDAGWHIHERRVSLVLAGDTSWHTALRVV
jgi:3-phenylpropionate/cinnamic acid dioxygenase small subunit